MTSIPPMQFIDWWIAKSDEQRMTFLANEQTSENVKRNLKALESYCRHYAYKVYCASQIRPRILPIKLDSFDIIDKEELVITHTEDQEHSLLYSPLLLSLFSNNNDNEIKNIVTKEELKEEEENSFGHVTLPREAQLLKHKKSVLKRLERFLPETVKGVFHTEAENTNNIEPKNILEQQLLELFAQLIVMLLSETTIAAAYRRGLVDSLHEEYKELAIKQREREAAKRQNRILRLSFTQNAELESSASTQSKTSRNANYLSVEYEEEQKEEEQEETSLIRNVEIHNEYAEHKPIEVYCKEMKALCGLEQLLQPMMTFFSSSETHKRKRQIDETQDNNISDTYNTKTSLMSSWTKLRLACAKAYITYLREWANENKRENNLECNTNRNAHSNNKNVNQEENNVKELQSAGKEKLTLTERDVRFAIEHLMRSQLFIDLTATIAALL